MSEKRTPTKPKVGRSVHSAREGGAISTNPDVTKFLDAARRIPKGGVNGLVFALDATMSRQPTWDRAQHEQARMFDTASKAGGLAIQLIYFRGFGECKASRYVEEAAELQQLMSRIDCRGGQTQISKVLTHVRKAVSGAKGKAIRPKALIYVGDAMEENPDELCQVAGELGVLGIPAFMFQEGYDPLAEATFREIARLTRGAYMRFGEGSASQLAELLGAVASFASGGHTALESRQSNEARLLLEQMR